MPANGRPDLIRRLKFNEDCNVKTTRFPETAISKPTIRITYYQLVPDTILLSIYLLEHILEGKREGMIEVRERVARKPKPLLCDFKEKRRFRKLKEEVLYRTVWRTRLARVCGPAVRQTME